MNRNRKLSIGSVVMVFLAVACEPPQPPQPRPPVATANIAPQTVNAGESVELDLARYFSDPDGDALTYRATTSDEGVAGATVAGSTLTITGVAPGTAQVIVTATDPGGLSAEQAVGVTVPNRAPAAAANIDPQTVNTGESVELDLAGHFSDPDGDALTYRAATSDEGVAAVAVAGSTLTIAGVMPGTAEVTVTATDPGGLSAEQAVGVTVVSANQAPVVTADFGPEAVRLGESAELDLARYFSDPDGDALTYRATTSDEGVAGATVAGSTLTITGVAPGTAQVTVTATDPGGLSAEQAVGVTVVSENQAPVVTADIAPQTLRPGQSRSVELDLARYFSDPDGDPLTYRATESDISKVYLVVMGSVLTIIGGFVGEADITVTATDPRGLSAEQTFGVRVVSLTSNLPPMVAADLAPQTVRAGVSVELDLAFYFSDRDGDALTYRAATSDPDVAGAAVAASTLTITGVTPGTADVTVTATDPHGLSVEQAVRVTVVSVSTQNLAPVAAADMAPQTIRAGASVELDAARYFNDPDGDALTYRAATSDEGVAAVAVAGSTLTITGVTPGTAEVTVTATDPDGLSAAQTLGVTVGPSNLAPVVTEPFAGQIVRREESVELDLARHFSDPDGDALTYRARTSDEGVAGATVAGSILTITGVAPGNAQVAVEAVDPHGLFTAQAVLVTVVSATTNLPPVVTEAIARQTVDPGESVELDLARYFSDPNGDSLTYLTEVSSTAVVTVTVVGPTLTITGVTPGPAWVGVRAVDPKGLYVDQVFYVTVRGEQSGDVEVLKRLYHATGGPNWTNNTNWLADSIPLSEWHGVIPTFDDPTAVDRLWLNVNYLTGPIPPELGQLSQATHIDLGGNYLTGPIPPEFGNLRKMTELYLWGNNLTGPIPPELGNLGSDYTTLTVLHLDENNLTGPVPRELANHRDLFIIRLNNNRLTGRLPAEFTSLVGLRMITWHDNDGLCVPRTAAFDAWLSSITHTSGPRCESSGSDR